MYRSKVSGVAAFDVIEPIADVGHVLLDRRQRAFDQIELAGLVVVLR